MTSYFSYFMSYMGHGSRARYWALALVSPKMSRPLFFLDFYVYPLIILLCLGVAALSTPATAIVEEFILGVLVWTFAEYLLHRFVLHAWPYFVEIHLAHHADAQDMIGTPTLFSVLFFYGGIYLPLWWLLGSSIALPSFAGFISGYLAFAGVHFFVHHSTSTNKLMRSWKKMHAIHHHSKAGNNYGVLTDFWDRVFGTYSPTIIRHTDLK